MERLHEEFRRRIKTQTVLPEAETAPMLFWALLASGQIVMRKLDGWETLAKPLSATAIDLAAQSRNSSLRRSPAAIFHHSRDGTADGFLRLRGA